MYFYIIMHAKISIVFLKTQCVINALHFHFIYSSRIFFSAPMKQGVT